MTLTPTEIESLRIAIAEECGWKIRYYSKKEEWVEVICPKGRTWNTTKNRISYAFKELLLPEFTTSLDAIQAAAMERFKDLSDQLQFNAALFDEIGTHPQYPFFWRLEALDWSIAFARTAKIWNYKQP